VVFILGLGIQLLGFFSSVDSLYAAPGKVSAKSESDPVSEVMKGWNQKYQKQDAGIAKQGLTPAEMEEIKKIAGSDG
jgi:hypothetical protein